MIHSSCFHEILLRFLCFYANSQLVDLQIFAALRVTLKPLVPTFPCFASITISLMEKVVQFSKLQRVYFMFFFSLI